MGTIRGQIKTVESVHGGSDHLCPASYGIPLRIPGETKGMDCCMFEVSSDGLGIGSVAEYHV
jgi:hypothetical protein